MRTPVDAGSLATPGAPLPVDGPAVLGAEVPVAREVGAASMVACGVRIRTRYLTSVYSGWLLASHKDAATYTAYAP
ncbi:hypothetical protein Plo01_70890 [Planobispora longispora]|uniref:Uncharacterized protein n=1 Tax=Planobispora longispora TaxID=28887 RepID=A0A8J3W969_9ACTN|nr:hypothetical protein Plo01_70890 [Planobispora longispora]